MTDTALFYSSKFTKLASKRANNELLFSKRAINNVSCRWNLRKGGRQYLFLEWFIDYKL